MTCIDGNKGSGLRRFWSDREWYATTTLSGLAFALLLGGGAAAQGMRWEAARILAGRIPAMAFDSTRGRTVLFGGMGDESVLLGDTWEYDGQAWQRRSASGPSPRFGHAMAYDPVQRRVILFGGADSTNAFGDTWSWDGDRWSQLAPAGTVPARFEHHMAYDSVRGRIVLFAGFDGSLRTDTWEWDGATWSQVATLGPQATSTATMAYDSARQRMVLYRPTVGGQPGETWEFNGSSWTLRGNVGTPTTSMGAAMAYDAAIARIVMFGGSFNASYSGTWQYDGTSWQAAVGQAPPDRGNAKMVFDSRRQCVVLFGGVGSGVPSTMLSDTWERSGSSWSRTTAATHPRKRFRHRAAVDEARRTVVVHGGSDGSLAWMGVAETWVWNGSRWTQAAGSGPGTVIRGAMAWDGNRQGVLHFGGLSVLPTNATWLWNGIGWSQRAPAVAPAARHSHAMAFDRARQRVILFGGDTSGIFQPTPSYLGDTWEWDGVNWTQRVVGSAPSPRGDHQIAEDQVRQKLVLYGGTTAAGTSSETWEWDGAQWSLANATSAPGARSQHTMAYDGTSSRVVMTGGTGSLLDAWQWTGTTWLGVAGTNAPGFLLEPTWVADPGRGRMLLFGGYRWNAVDDTWWFGPLTTATTQEVGVPCPNPTGPRLTNTEMYLGNERFALELTHTQPGAPCLFGWSTGTLPLAIGPCTLYLDAPIAAEAVLADAYGVARSSPWPQSAVATWRGFVVHAQAVTLDPLGPLGLGFSPMRRMTLGD